MDIENIQKSLREFAKERDWDQFHNPKNLAMALSGEAGELLEIFQWLSAEQSLKENLHEEDLKSVTDEIADVVIYALRLSDKLGIDLESAIDNKIKKNAEKYPVDLAKGNAIKYSRRDK